MWQRLLGLDLRRRLLLRHAVAGPLRDFYATPFPRGGDDCRAVEFIALDLETTGLDARREQILSVGLVPVRHLRIELGGAQHRLVRPDQAIPETSAVIHAITDDEAAGGEPLSRVLAELLPLLAGRVLIAHHAQLELQFLSCACERLYGAPFLIPVVDTLHLAQRSLERRQQPYRQGALRLAALREHHRLPRYRLHNALSDALAAAELFLAQLAHYDAALAVPLRNFLLKV